jgi:hypothetical protein
MTLDQNDMMPKNQEECLTSTKKLFSDFKIFEFYFNQKHFLLLKYINTSSDDG